MSNDDANDDAAFSDLIFFEFEWSATNAHAHDSTSRFKIDLTHQTKNVASPPTPFGY
jgi:hypothetical protein